MEEVVIVDYLRTPFSRSRPAEPERDVFNSENMPALAGRLIKKIIERTKINPEEIGDVLTGCTMQMTEQWLYGGRAVAMLADLPINVPAQGVERVCCSGMSAIHTGAMEITQGYSDIVFACGIEHMTHLGMDMSLNPHLNAWILILMPMVLDILPRTEVAEFVKYGTRQFRKS